MHHYRSREDDAPQSNSGDPYFYLRLSAGAAPYNPIKLEVDVKPESRMTPVVCLQQQQPSGSPSEAMVMNIAGDESGGGGGGGGVCKDGHDGTTGLGLLALTQLDGYSGYKSSPYCSDAVGGEGVISSTGLLENRIDDEDKSNKYSYGRLIYSSSDDIKHQVFVESFFYSLWTIFFPTYNCNFQVVIYRCCRLRHSCFPTYRAFMNTSTNIRIYYTNTCK